MTITSEFLSHSVEVIIVICQATIYSLILFYPVFMQVMRRCIKKVRNSCASCSCPPTKDEWTPRDFHIIHCHCSLLKEYLLLKEDTISSGLITSGLVVYLYLAIILCNAPIIHSHCASPEINLVYKNNNASVNVHLPLVLQLHLALAQASLKIC